ncbi:MAG TPA: DinB family protein, partial [Terriglobales bacterium]|nr:DinB family protein [Terriglobales bacterium]
LSAPWTVTHNGQPAVTIPKETAIRMFMLNHWHHHRGQLTVYLRLLGVPLPPVYAASADENPFS